MTEKPPSGKLPTTESEHPETASPVEHNEDASTSDPFDELWDPDMDTRPERIRRTRARTRPEAHTRGGGGFRGKRRDAV